MKTSRPHFEELDWLDYAEGRVAPALRGELRDHLSGCTPCQARIGALRRLTNALPALQAVLEPPEPRASDLALMDRAAHSAAEIARAVAASQEDLRRALVPPLDRPGLAEEHVLGALRNAREAFLANPEHAVELVEWAVAALAVLETRGPLAWPGIPGVVRSYQAYITFRNGRAREALDQLEAARPFLDRFVPLRDLEIAFWSYVSAACLHNLSRFAEALTAVRDAEELYAAFGDEQRVVRTRILLALILCDAGLPARALPIHESLLRHPAARAEQPIYAQLYLNYASNLVFLNRLAPAKVAYAATARLLRATNQRYLLFKVRTGMADIAHCEGRFADALAINLALRPEYRRQHLAWDEVRRELWIIRELLALDRFDEALADCRALATRAAEISLPEEARRALSYLADAQQALDGIAVEEVSEDLHRIVRGEATRWSAA